MGLHGKLVAAIEFKAGGDLFHEIMAKDPHHFSTTSPEKMHGCELHEGEFGKQGSIICWTYTHEGEQRITKELIQTADEEKKLIQLKVLEGYLSESYKDFTITMHIETKDGIDLVTWTLDYETINDEVGHPVSFLAYLMELTKDLETHHLKK